MVVQPVDEHDLDRFTVQPRGRIESGEAPADDHDTRQRVGIAARKHVDAGRGQMSVGTSTGA